LIGVVEEVGPSVQNLKHGDPNPTANDGTMSTKESKASKGEVPLVITRSGTPHPHQLEPEARPKARVRPHRRPHASKLDY
jgi:hypothetical protein